MRILRSLGLAAMLAGGLALVPSAAHAQISVGIGLGPIVEYPAPVYVAGPPVCEWGYYPYYPYACAPYGYYGDDWFYDGLFIGAGPWYTGWYGRPWGWGYGRIGYYGWRGHGWYGHDWDHDRWRDRDWGRGYRGGYRDGHGYRGGYGYHGREAIRPFYGNNYRNHTGSNYRNRTTYNRAGFGANNRGSYNRGSAAFHGTSNYRGAFQGRSTVGSHNTIRPFYGSQGARGMSGSRSFGAARSSGGFHGAVRSGGGFHGAVRSGGGFHGGGAMRSGGGFHGGGGGGFHGGGGHGGGGFHGGGGHGGHR